MKRILLVSFSLFTLSTLAENGSGPSHCGIYQVKGVAHFTKEGPVIVVNEKTQSEIIISVPLTNEARLAPYIDHALTAVIILEKKPSSHAFLATIKDIESRVPNPLSPQETSIKIISKAKCQ